MPTKLGMHTALCGAAMGATLRFWRRHWMVQLTGVAVLLTGWASLSVRQLPVSPPSQCIEVSGATAPAPPLPPPPGQLIAEARPPHGQGRVGGS